MDVLHKYRAVHQEIENSICECGLARTWCERIERDTCEATPRFDWYVCLTQWAIGFAWKPRREYAIEFSIGPLVLTYRWRHGWWKESR
jgi:hypothetical protein